MDGYRAITVKDGGVALFSRHKKSLGKKFPYIVEALADLPAGTVVDGELVALDDLGSSVAAGDRGPGVGIFGGRERHARGLRQTSIW